MRPLLKIALASFLVMGSSALAANLQEESYFYKISKALRGVPPTYDERAAFEAAAAQGQSEAFLQAKIQEFTKTPQFSVKLKQKVDELFRFNAEPNLPTGTPSSPYDTHVVPQSAYDNLVTKVISQNQSWDQLLLSKTYQISGGSDMDGHAEKQFYSIALSNKNPQPSIEDSMVGYSMSSSYYNPSSWQNIVFPDQDLRVAGVVTTPRFFGRYANTALNKNRRRASTVFRIFLCDGMTPSVPTHDAATEDANFDLVFPNHAGLTEDQIHKGLQPDVHGQMPDCRACHYKLDPMGQTFGFSAATLAPMPAHGALTYKGSDNRAVNIPVNGLGDLAQKITEQPEYVSCQVQHFWTWYVGRDVFISKTRQNELVEKFNQLGRKPQDFVAYLTSTPEFRQRSETLNENQLLARGAVKILQNCYNCHSNEPQSGDMKYWDLTDLPYGDDSAMRGYAIDRLNFALDIDGDGSHRFMPPKESMWQLSSDDYATLKTWILHGAPDFKGTPQVPAKQSKNQVTP